MGGHRGRSELLPPDLTQTPGRPATLSPGNSLSPPPLGSAGTIAQRTLGGSLGWSLPLWTCEAFGVRRARLKSPQPLAAVTSGWP